MDVVLCDELVQEILRRLPPSSSPSLSLVSKRWLSLLRSSTTSLSLRVPPLLHSSIPTSNPHPSQLSSILAHYPSLTDLTVVSARQADPDSDALLLAIASASCSPRLSHLRFLPASPLSPSALLSSSSAFARLTSLHIASLLPLSFRWLSFLPSLKSFSLVRSRPKRPPSPSARRRQEPEEPSLPPLPAADHVNDDGDGDQSALQQLPLESLSLSGICATDRGLSWLWRRCAGLRWLQLRACEGTGDDLSHPAFPLCLPGLLGLELRTCRAIADRVLLQAADRCRALISLLLYDGGSRDALHHFIHCRGAALHTLDLRLPLDLHNDHLFAIAADDHRRDASMTGRQLAALHLHSCCLVTGDGLRSLARSPVGEAIEELALVTCDVVEREPGLLTCLGQSMVGLRRLDLSHNETLADKELGSMLASCKNLVEIRLRGCRALTDASLIALLKHCGRQLEVVDITRCPGIDSDAIELLVMNACKLSQLMVEECKLTEAALVCLSRKAIKVG